MPSGLLLAIVVPVMLPFVYAMNGTHQNTMGCKTWQGERPGR